MTWRSIKLSGLLRLVLLQRKSLPKELSIARSYLESFVSLVSKMSKYNKTYLKKNKILFCQLVQIANYFVLLRYCLISVISLQGCERPANVVFVMDESGSIEFMNYEKEKEFVR